MRWRALAATVAVAVLAGCTSGPPAPERAPQTPAPTAGGGEPAWRTLAPVPTERTEVAAAAVGDRIWVLGGYAPDGATLATAEVYDTTTDTWATGPDLPVAVNHAMAATLDGVLYVAGGNDGDGPSTQVARLEGDTWRRLAPLPQGRSAGGLVALEGRLYLVGGVVDGGLANDTQVYDPATDRWSSAPGLPTPSFVGPVRTPRRPSSDIIRRTGPALVAGVRSRTATVRSCRSSRRRSCATTSATCCAEPRPVRSSRSQSPGGRWRSSVPRRGGAG